MRFLIVCIFCGMIAFYLGYILTIAYFAVEFGK